MKQDGLRIAPFHFGTLAPVDSVGGREESSKAVAFVVTAPHKPIMIPSAKMRVVLFMFSVKKAPVC
jgi:hypothetical protein